MKSCSRPSRASPRLLAGSCCISRPQTNLHLPGNHARGNHARGIHARGTHLWQLHLSRTRARGLRIWSLRSIKRLSLVSELSPTPISAGHPRQTYSSPRSPLARLQHRRPHLVRIGLAPFIVSAQLAQSSVPSDFDARHASVKADDIQSFFDRRGHALDTTPFGPGARELLHHINADA